MTKKQKRQLDKRLQAYSNKARTGLSKNGKLVAQSAMAVGAVLVAGGVQGQTIDETDLPFPMGVLTATGYAYFSVGVDFDGDASPEVGLYGVNVYIDYTDSMLQYKGIAAFNGIIGVFQAGSTIPTAPTTSYTLLRFSSFFTYYGLPYGPGGAGDLDADNRFVGVRFNKGGADYFGWLEIVYDPLPNNLGDPAFTLVDFYYSDSPVIAGEKDPPAAVPLSPLALGATAGLMGLYALLRNRKRKETVEA